MIIIDPERDFQPGQIDKLRMDVEETGMSLVVFADWYNGDVMRSLQFFDQVIGYMYRENFIWVVEGGMMRSPQFSRHDTHTELV